jgi:hypothetical protein
LEQVISDVIYFTDLRVQPYLRKEKKPNFSQDVRLRKQSHRPSFGTIQRKEETKPNLIPS